MTNPVFVRRGVAEVEVGRPGEGARALYTRVRKEQ
jgi:hypothetical protein